MSQNTEILKFMQEGHVITPITALEEFGCFRLASRICDIEKMGYHVERKKISRKSRRTGKTVSYCKYWMGRKAEDS